MRTIVKSFILYFVLIPFLLGLLVFASYITVSPDAFPSVLRIGVIIGIPALMLGYSFAKRIENPIESKQHLLVLVPLFITSMMVAVFMVISKGFIGHHIWAYFAFSHIVYFPAAVISSLYGELQVVVMMPFLYEAVFALTAFIVWFKKGWHNIFANKLLALIAASCIVVGGVFWQRQKTVLPGDGKPFAGGYSSIDLWAYDLKNPDNTLATLDEPSTYRIDDPKQMPILDGAEAVVPLYHAIAQAVYQDIASLENNAVQSDQKAEKLNGKIVPFTNTIHGYERLLNGEVDIFIGAKPSAKQLKKAEEMNLELQLHPIGKEAFVFFVNPSNPVTSLSADQIRDIYSGKTTNWKQLGGSNQTIQAFQRPENSGSQSMMVTFMNNIPLKTPLKEEAIHGMGEIIERVAEYRSTENAIGYSFRYYLQQMNDQMQVKVLAVDGIMPTTETIKNGTYPVTGSLYAITLRDHAKDTVLELVEWIKSDQGQKLIEKVGYVPIE